MPYTRAKDGARIFYRVRGPADGEPLVLIMGLGWDMTGWHLLMPRLKDYRVLRLDNRGTGRSDKPDHPYSIRQMAGDVIRCMNDAGFDSAHVYGGSLGGMIAQELALCYPGRVRSLVLGCTSAGILAFPGSPGLARAWLRRQPMTPEESFMRAAPYLYGAALTERPEAVEEVMRRRIASNVSPIGFRRQLEAVVRWSSLFRLRQIEAPTLVIHGDRDRLLPAANGRLIARLVPQARLAILKGAGHVYGTDRPDEHLEVLMDWLREHSRSRELAATG
jgi:pimeloyl-ACP methyl ester carboxylesterase